MTEIAAPFLSEEAIAAALASWRELGYARLGKLADDATVERLRARTDALMLGEVRHEGMFFQREADGGRYEDLPYGRGWEGPTLEYRKVEKLEMDPLFRAWLEQPLFGRLARAAIGEDAIALCRAVLFTKSAGGGTHLPWHQDGGLFWGLDRDPPITVWTALDDAPADGGCLEVLPRSHLAGLTTKMGGVVPKPMVAARAPERDAVLLPARAGEVILLHNHCWHRSGVSHTGRARRAFTVCYMSAATKCLRKKRTPRTFLRLFTAGLAVIAAVAAPRAARACGSATPGGPAMCPLELPRDGAPPRRSVRAAASWTHTWTAVTFGPGQRADLERDAVFVGSEVAVSPAWSVQYGAGAVVAGEVRTPARAFALGPGAALYAGVAGRLVDGRGAAPFVLFTCVGSGTRAATRGTDPLTAFDLRLGLVAGKTLWDTVTPYVATRVFGGPIVWRYDGGASATGTDVYKYQLGGGVSLAVARGAVTAFVEGIGVGERGLSAGLGARLD